MIETGLETRTVERAAQSQGSSEVAILECVAELLRGVEGPVVDLGCGRGALFERLGRSARYLGCDAVRYEGFPTDARAELRLANLDRLPLPIDDAFAGAVVAIETIEHLENPRALFREMMRIARPGGMLVVTTPNQLSLLSKLTLVVKNEFNAFQEAPGLYPAHITALLESDLRRIASECGATAVEVRYTNHGRIPGTPLRWPRFLGGRRFSDNVILSARRPAS